MKKVKISSLKDRQKFRISDRSDAATYKLHSLAKNEAVYSSVKSKRTFRCKLSKTVFATK